MKQIQFKSSKTLSLDIWKTGKNNIKSLRKVFLLHLFLCCVNYKKSLMKIQLKKKKSLKAAGKKFLPLLENILKKIPNKYMNLNRKIRIYKYLKRKSRQLFQKQERIISDLIFILENKREKSFARMTPYAHALKLRKLFKLYYGNIKFNTLKNVVRKNKYYLGNIPKSSNYTITKYNHVNFLKLMESRLDKVLLESFFGFSIWQTKQLIMHGNIYVNNKQIKIPGYLVKEGDLIEFKDTGLLYNLYNNKIAQNLSFMFSNIYQHTYLDDAAKKALLTNLHKIVNSSNITEISSIKQSKYSDNFLSNYNNTLGCFSFFKPFAKNFIFFGNKVLFLRKSQETFSHIIDKTNLVSMLNWLNK